MQYSVGFQKKKFSSKFLQTWILNFGHTHTTTPLSRLNEFNFAFQL